MASLNICRLNALFQLLRFSFLVEQHGSVSFYSLILILAFFHSNANYQRALIISNNKPIDGHFVNNSCLIKSNCVCLGQGLLRPPLYVCNGRGFFSFFCIGGCAQSRFVSSASPVSDREGHL
ncbi:unnamed protein product [Choristocarpus tenellus]